MKLGLLCTIRGPIPTIRPPRPFRIRVRRSDETWDIEGDDVALLRLDQMLQFVADQGGCLETFFLGGDISVEPTDPLVVGAVLFNDDSLPLLTTNHFDPVFPAQCLGAVPETDVLRIGRRPKGHVIGVRRRHMLFSRQMQHFLNHWTKAALGSVECQGKQLDWKRYYPERCLSVLAPEGFEDVHCQQCGTPYRSWIGVFLGKRSDDLTVACDAIRVDHRETARQYLISPSIAERLQTEMPHGYALRPIVDVESELGQMALQIHRRLTAEIRHPGTSVDRE